MKKILNTSDLKKKIEFLNKKHKKIILCHGVFDLFHVGHLKYFNSAKKNADFLIVSITADQYVNKGNGRPIFNHFLRAETIAGLTIVDAVYINNFPTAVEIINLVKPDIYYKGPDYKNLRNDKSNNIVKEINATKQNGGVYKTANEIVFSSSKLINSEFNLYNKEQKKFLDIISKKYNFNYIYNKINELKNKRVLLIGETIIDQYIFGEIIGKSGKEPHLVMKKNIEENYLGGAGAIANHLSSFCRSVNLLTIVGEKKEYLSFIKDALKNNINSKFFYKKNSPTIIKRRFVDHISKNKLLGVYSINDEFLTNNVEKKIKSEIKKLSKINDLIIISDYGHGMLSPGTVKFIKSLKKFISLNTQINAANYGYHSLSKYKDMDILLINETELRHELRDKKTKIEKISYLLIKKFNIKTLIVTRGGQGSILIRKNSKPIYCPGFANKITDKVGAGDAMFAIVSLCLRFDIPDHLTLYLGSLAASFSVENIGNSVFVNREKLLKQLEYSIKSI